MRMVVFSLILMGFMIFMRRGLLGRNEFSWRWLVAVLGRGPGRGQGQEEARR
jgi:branched-chain amino acid transport system permease protein